MTDINDSPFYPNSWNDKDKEIIRKTALWPLILTLHFNSQNKLFVTHFGYNANDPDKKDSTVIMGLITGIYIVKLEFKAGEYRLFTMHDRITGISKDKPFIESVNQKYISQKLQVNSNGAGWEIEYQLDKAEQEEFQGLFSQATHYFNQEAGKPGYINTQLSTNASACAVRLLHGENRDNFPDGILDEIDRMHEVILSQHKKMEKFAARAVEVFNHDKWIIGKSMDGYIVGCIDASNLAKEAVTGNFIMPVFIYPFRLVKTLESIDPEIKDEFMAALTFHKVSREANNQKTRCFDKQDLLPADNKYYSDTGALSWYGGNEQRWFMCDRLAQ